MQLPSWHQIFYYKSNTGVRYREQYEAVKLSLHWCSRPGSEPCVLPGNLAQHEPGLLPRVHGLLGAELLQLRALVHTVYPAGWLLSCRHAEETGTSEEQWLLPQFEIAALQAGSRHGKGVAADFQRLRGGQEWECSLVGAGGMQRGLL